MIVPTLRKPLLLLLCLHFFAAPAPAQETPLRRVELAHGISLMVPAQWIVQPPGTRQGLETTREALSSKAGIEKPRGNKEQLLAVNATPEPAGAMIRLNLSSPAEFTQADLAAVGPEELKALRSELLGTFEKLEAAGGPKVLKVHPLRIEQVNGHLALVIPYLRAGAPTASPWEVIQYKIPASGRLIELTLSYRQLEAAEWKTVLEHVQRSLRF
jgi:hypothetical protein